MRENNLSFYQRYFVKQAQIIGYILKRENNERDFTNYYEALVGVIKSSHPKADAEQVRQLLSHSILDFTEQLLLEPSGIARVQRMYSRDIFLEIQPLLLKRLQP